jgi:glycosyltransferase involved in cell wall biosynthesis
LKVVFLFLGMPVGGAEDLALGVYPYLAPDVSAQFVCLRKLDVLGEEALDKGLPVKLLPFFLNKRINPLAIWRFSRWLRQERITVLHTQTYHAHIFGCAAAMIARVSLVIHQQKTLANLPWRKKVLFRWCLNRARIIITLTEKTRAQINKEYFISPSIIKVVPNAIDDQIFYPVSDKTKARRALGLQEDGFLFGTVASLHEVKNHRIIIDALVLSNTKAKLVFVGDGVERKNLECLAKDRGVAERVLFAGYQRPVEPWFQALDTFILASVWEGQPLAMLQAVSCGLPILASSIEGNIAVVGEFHCGLFDSSSPTALASLMNAVMEEPSRFLACHAKVATCKEAATILKTIYSEAQL